MKTAGLRYVSCRDAGIRRIKRGGGFAYLLPNGKRLTDSAELERIRKLALPPAWRNVWICSDPHGHLQATGVDAKGRKQYRYDVRWRAARDEKKYGDLLEFGSILPALRHRLAFDLNRPGLCREKVLATVVSLMAETGVRVGNERYCEENGSFGLTTLLDRHAKIRRECVEFSFRGKAGKLHRLRVADAKLARIVKRCRDIPGQRLFQYVDGRGGYQSVCSDDVNDYVRRVTGAHFTAKTFRTWLASVSALAELRKLEPAGSITARKRQLNLALAGVAERLGNTLAICRKSYVHPALFTAFLQNELPAPARARRSGLSREECDLMAFLETLTHRRHRLAA
jgi:DNA topoisomerase-1